MNNAFLALSLLVSYLAALPALSQARGGSSMTSVPTGGHNGGFASPNIYGYTGSYTGGAGYSSNFGYNTMRPGNMPLGYGYNGAYGAPYGYSAFGQPQAFGAAGQAFYTINYGGRPVSFWQSPNGYYYPWVTGYNAPIVYVAQAGQAPQAETPAISTICSDFLSYLDQQQSKGNLSEEAYEHLKRRVTDIRNHERDLRISGGGAVDSQDEAQMRRDLEWLGAEVAQSVSP